MPPRLFAICIAIQIALAAIIPIWSFDNVAIRTAGLLPIIAGLALNIAESRAFAATGIPIHPDKSPPFLRTRGAFRLSRNPMYLGMTLFLIGVALITGCLSPFLVPPVYARVISRRFIVPEELRLRALFGAEYDLYQSNVRRWL